MVLNKSFTWRLLKEGPHREDLLNRIPKENTLLGMRLAWQTQKSSGCPHWLWEMIESESHHRLVVGPTFNYRPAGFIYFFGL